MTGTALVTIVAGRHDHLRAQLCAVAAGTDLPDRHIIVAMGDPGVAAVVEQSCGTAYEVISVPVGSQGLPLSHARNVGAAVARCDADVLIFLDVDCLPTPALVGRYRELASRADQLPAVMSGDVSYLPPRPPGGYDAAYRAAAGEAHPARPFLRDDEVQTGERPELFWSLAFGLSGSVWDRVGGFDEAYVGYGAEDTDFGMRMASRGVDHWRVGGARADHQHHESHSPPLAHVTSIVRNANIFHDRWGSWPMTTWLTEFERRGLTSRDMDGRWCLTGGPTSHHGESEKREPARRSRG